MSLIHLQHLNLENEHMLSSFRRHSNVSILLLIRRLCVRLRLKPQLLNCLFGGCESVCRELVFKGFRGRKRKETFPLSEVVFDRSGTSHTRCSLAVCQCVCVTDEVVGF